MDESRMRIGAFAEAAGISIDAVRFYERRGVLPSTPRTPGGYRTFDDHDLDRIRMARQLQQLGLTVPEVVSAFSAHDAGDATCATERWRLEQVDAHIETQMAQLRLTRRHIRDALAACDAGHCQFASVAQKPPRPAVATSGNAQPRRGRLDPARDAPEHQTSGHARLDGVVAQPDVMGRYSGHDVVPRYLDDASPTGGLIRAFDDTSAPAQRGLRCSWPPLRRMCLHDTDPTEDPWPATCTSPHPSPTSTAPRT